MDGLSECWNVVLDPKAREKTAFTTGKELFKFTVLPFGATNAPSAFSRLMEQVLVGLHFSACLIYLDDVISFGKDFAQATDRIE